MINDKKEILKKELISLIGTNVTVYIDRPIGYNHNGLIYEQNYGYIKEYIALDNEYQDAYVIGINEKIDKYYGKVIAVIEREDDIEDKLVVCDINKGYTDEEIRKLVDFQERYFKSRIIRK